MDDELPIIIYVIVMSDFRNQYAQCLFLDDFARADPNIENEKRVLTNIKVSLDYISSEWNV